MTANHIDEELTQPAIRQALEQHGYYFETVEAADHARVEYLDRLGRAVADELGVEVSMAARPRRRDHGVQVCLTVVKELTAPEPA